MPTITPTDVTVIRTYKVTDAEPIAKRYTSVRVIPEEVAVTFDNGKPVRVVIVGPNAKKDGSAGANFHEASYSYDMNSLPEWVRPLLEFQPA